MVTSTAMILGGLLMILGKYEYPVIRVFRFGGVARMSTSLRQAYPAHVCEEDDLTCLCQSIEHKVH